MDNNLARAQTSENQQAQNVAAHLIPNRRPPTARQPRQRYEGHDLVSTSSRNEHSLETRQVPENSGTRQLGYNAATNEHVVPPHEDRSSYSYYSSDQRL